jgi:lysozyme family protein
VAVIDEVIALVLQREGGVADVDDGKGTTYFGQTTDWLDQFGLPVPQTRTDAAVNYRLWLSKTGLVQVIGPVFDELADIVVDIAVMSDHRKAIKALQATLGLTADGVLGPQTLTAFSKADRKQLAKDVVAWDMSYQGRLITQDPRRAKYAAGWANRMAQHVRRL